MRRPILFDPQAKRGCQWLTLTAEGRWLFSDATLVSYWLRSTGLTPVAIKDKMCVIQAAAEGAGAYHQKRLSALDEFIRSLISPKGRFIGYAVFDGCFGVKLLPKSREREVFRLARLLYQTTPKDLQPWLTENPWVAYHDGRKGKIEYPEIFRVWNLAKADISEGFSLLEGLPRETNNSVINPPPQTAGQRIEDHLRRLQEKFLHPVTHELSA